MSATITQNLTPEQTRRYFELIEDPTPWTMAEIAVHLAVQPQTVRSWRKDSLAAATKPGDPTAAPHPNQLPEVDIPITGKPTWRAGTIRRWAIHTKRMELDGTPKRLKPPGRPRAPRVEGLSGHVHQAA